MNDTILLALLSILTLFFFLGAIMLRRMRLGMEKKSIKNSASLFHVRSEVDKKK